MKASLLLLLLFALVGHASAQDSTLEAAADTTLQAHRAEQRRLEADRKRVERLLEKKPAVAYGGVLKEFRDTPEKKKFFSLRRPVDPKRDYKHIIYDPLTEKPKGFTLFSLSF